MIHHRQESVEFVQENISSSLESKTKAVFVLGENHFRKCFSVNAGVWLVLKIEFSGNHFHLTVKKKL